MVDCVIESLLILIAVDSNSSFQLGLTPINGWTSSNGCTRGFSGLFKLLLYFDALQPIW